MRRPVDYIARITVRRPYGQDGIWQVIRDLRRFDVAGIRARVEADGSTIRDYVNRLEKGGFVRRVDGDKRAWDVAIDQPETPRLRKDGSPCAETGRGQDNMWRSMKMLPRFDAAELARAASADPVTVDVVAAKNYIHHLFRAGYLTQVAPGQAGGRKTARLAVYALKPAMNSGPLAPQIQRTDWVWDPNTKRAISPDQGREGTRDGAP
jgi:hypothetical protein